MNIYKQKVENINYLENNIKIGLKRDEWNSVTTWISAQCFSYKQNDLISDLANITMSKINFELNFAGKDYSYENDIEFQIHRIQVRYFIDAIGLIAYSFEVKPITSKLAKNILDKVEPQINKQLIADNNWQKFRF